MFEQETVRELKGGQRGSSLRLTLVNFNPWSQAYRACRKGQRDGYRFESNADLTPFLIERFGELNSMMSWAEGAARDEGITREQADRWAVGW